MFDAMQVRIWAGHNAVNPSTWFAIINMTVIVSTTANFNDPATRLVCGTGINTATTQPFVQVECSTLLDNALFVTVQAGLTGSSTTLRVAEVSVLRRGK